MSDNDKKDNEGAEAALAAADQQAGRKMILDGLDRINDPTITYFLGMIVDRIADLVQRGQDRAFETQDQGEDQTLARGPRSGRRSGKPN